MITTIGRVTSEWGTRFWFYRGKRKYLFSLGCGMFFITVER